MDDTDYEAGKFLKKREATKILSGIQLYQSQDTAWDQWKEGRSSEQPVSSDAGQQAGVLELVNCQQWLGRP